MLNTLAASRALMDHIKKGASAIHELLRVPLFNRHIQLRLESVVRSVYTNVNYLETYIYIYIPEKGGTKASSRQTSVSFSRGRRGTKHMVGSLRVSGAVDAGGRM